MTFWKNDNRNIIQPEKEMKYLEGIISFKQSADRKNELIYRTNDGNKYNYVISDVQSWEKLDNGHVLIECGKKQYDFTDLALTDAQKVKELCDGYADGQKMSMARVGINYGEDINVLDSAYMVEINEKDEIVKELKQHQFDLCNHNHYIVGEYKDSEGINQTIKINARDINNIVIGEDEFIIKDNQDRVFSSKGLSYELERAREELITDLGYTHLSPAELLLKLHENTGKQVIILTSDSMIQLSDIGLTVDPRDVTEELVGRKIEIYGERINLKSGDVYTEPEKTEILDVVTDNNSAYELTIMEGQDNIYVSFDRYRELHLELTAIDSHGNGFSGGVVPEYELYQTLIADYGELTQESELELDGPGMTM